MRNEKYLNTYIVKYACSFILLLVSITGWSQKRPLTIADLGENPVFYLDSVEADQATILRVKPETIASLTIHDDSSSVKLVGPRGVDGVVFIETKSFARHRYWRFLSSRSSEYAKQVPTPESDNVVQYILNDRILTNDFEGNLSLLNDSLVKEIQIVNRKYLKKKYGIKGKQFGVVILASPPANLFNADKKF